MLTSCRDDIRTKHWLPGFGMSSLLCTVIVSTWFGMRWWEAVIAIAFGIPLAIICVQCNGETDNTPTGAIGKMSQLLFAIVTPNAPVPNLMAANIAAAGSFSLRSRLAPATAAALSLALVGGWTCVGLSVMCVCVCVCVYCQAVVSPRTSCSRSRPGTS